MQMETRIGGGLAELVDPWMNQRLGPVVEVQLSFRKLAREFLQHPREQFV